MILLYRVTGMIRLMALPLGVLNRSGDTVDSACDGVHGVFVM